MLFRRLCEFLTDSAAVRWLSLLIVIYASTLAGCTHLEYSRISRTTEGLSHDPNTDAAADQTYSMQLKAQELVLLDGTGGVCAALATSSGASNARMDAERKLIEQGGYSTNYSYRVYSPAEFSGLNCGIYYKWGGGQAERNYVWPGDGGGR